ncbi:c(7)-type cytochrome triheme domain-containing protein [Malonomonas rubra DSM 5091]|uniref:C(7)-type cytochrome triheme domain-containing protein n=1 Tax=Malonomonas rubra DSM 5091 TaxID=1122189 RepID=A0A1M6I1T2_MALRU|nr:cytochrome c3 family protein [Malonomonas rubra]SHJ28411.1 c(7)-type cytochrome triheme domain-containing protein [Malonomonas rubra DSM 5091]
MKKILILLAVAIFCASAVAVAVPPNKTLEFTDSSMGKVLFSGKVHADAGIKCMECHNKGMFPKMKKGTVDITMAEIYSGKLCGVCHNGKRAFEAKASCNRCHVK